MEVSPGSKILDKLEKFMGQMLNKMELHDNFLQTFMDVFINPTKSSADTQLRAEFREAALLRYEGESYMVCISDPDKADHDCLHTR